MNSQGSRKKRSTPSRKKACESCAASKVRCGLEKPACSRCRAQAKQCRYSSGDETPVRDHTGILPESPSVSGQSHDHVDFSYTGDFSFTGTTQTSPPYLASSNAIPGLNSTQPIGNPPSSKACLNFDNIHLIPMEEAEEIRNYWMRSLLSPISEVPKVFHPYTLECISCILRSYPDQMLADNDVPPIIHPMQLSARNIPSSLANCFSLVRLWQKRAPRSEETVASVLKQEMQRLIDLEPTESDFDLLCSFQAYLIYMILAYFFPIDNVLYCDDSSMMTLQEIAFRSAKAGVMCGEESFRSRPSWETWIVASAKRRCLFVMYIFSNLYHARQGVPNYVAKELRGMFVPEGKRLWNARDRREWEIEYSHHLTQWEDGMLEISELWRSPDTGSEGRRRRISRWLQSTDEFGMMLFMTSGHLHGC